MNHPWFYFLCGFAGIGAGTVVLWIRNGWKRFIETVNTLTTTLQDAAEVAKAYREEADRAVGGKSKFWRGTGVYYSSTPIPSSRYAIPAMEQISGEAG